MAVGGGGEHRAFAAAPPRVRDSIRAAHFKAIPRECGTREKLENPVRQFVSAVSLREMTGDAEE